MLQQGRKALLRYVPAVEFPGKAAQVFDGLIQQFFAAGNFVGRVLAVGQLKHADIQPHQ